LQSRRHRNRGGFAGLEKRVAVAAGDEERASVPPLQSISLVGCGRASLYRFATVDSLKAVSFLGGGWSGWGFEWKLLLLYPFLCSYGALRSLD